MRVIAADRAARGGRGRGFANVVATRLRAGVHARARAVAEVSPVERGGVGAGGGLASRGGGPQLTRAAAAARARSSTRGCALRAALLFGIGVHGQRVAEADSIGLIALLAHTIAAAFTTNTVRTESALALAVRAAGEAVLLPALATIRAAVTRLTLRI